MTADAGDRLDGPPLPADTIAQLRDADPTETPAASGVELCAGCKVNVPAEHMRGRGRRRRCATCRQVDDDLANAAQADRDDLAASLQPNPPTDDDQEDTAP